MKKERQIGIRVGLPAFFALELEDVYKHTQGAHKALAFPDFVGLLVGLGLEQYKGTKEPEKDEESEEPLHLLDIAPGNLPDLFRVFDEAMEEEMEKPGPHLVHGKNA